MSGNRHSCRWRERIPARVFACLLPGELRLTLNPGAGMADGGTPIDVPIDSIPPDLRMPNTDLWVCFDEEWHVQEVRRRERQ